MVSLAAPDADLPPPRTTGCIGRHRDSKGNKDDGETSSDFESQGGTGCIQSDLLGLGWAGFTEWSLVTLQRASYVPMFPLLVHFSGDGGSSSPG
jgi:hypothetical protein